MVYGYEIMKGSFAKISMSLVLYLWYDIEIYPNIYVSYRYQPPHPLMILSPDLEL